MDDRTRLVSVAWVSHQNGFRHDMRPLADVAHAHGALFYTDAVQALGMFPANVRAAVATENSVPVGAVELSGNDG
jgi:cysteine desulfurase / selenocysteine lyase